MSEEDDLKEQARELFTQSKGEVLSDTLHRMEGWFHITDGESYLDDRILSLDNGTQYMTYLLAAFVAEFIGERESKFVNHKEANDYFGWGNGRTAKDYASDFSHWLNTHEGGKAIAGAKLGEVVDRVAEKLEG